MNLSRKPQKQRQRAARREPPTHHDGLRPRERGVVMLEALITIVILAFGLLGLAGLQAKMQAAEMESYQRSQALVLLEDMGHRLSANRGKAADYVTVDPINGAVGTGDGQPADCSGMAVGQPRDICEWSNALKGIAERVGGAAVGSAIDSRGCIELVAGAVPPSYRIVVVWQGLNPTTVPAFGCAAGSYGGDDALRRAVVKVVSVATLILP